MKDNKTVVFHIGMHKTGTTTLQKSFFKNEAIFKSLGIYFPIHGREGADRQIIHSNLAWELLGHGGYSAERGGLTDILKEVECIEADKVIITTEGLSRLEDPEQLVSCFASFKKIVIFYVRRQDLIAPSRYTEDLKFGYSKSFDSWLQEKSKNYFNFNRHYRRWSPYVDKMVVRVLDSAQMVGGDVVSDFVSSLTNSVNFNDRVDCSKFTSVKTANKRIGACYALSLLAFNKELMRGSGISRVLNQKKMRLINKFRTLAAVVIKKDLPFNPFSYDEALKYYQSFDQYNNNLFKKAGIDGFTTPEEEEYLKDRVRYVNDFPYYLQSQYISLLFFSLSVGSLLIGNKESASYYFSESLSSNEQGETLEQAYTGIKRIIDEEEKL